MEHLPSYMYVKSLVKSLLNAKSINHEDINEQIAEHIAAKLFLDILDKRLSLLENGLSKLPTNLYQYSTSGLSLDLNQGVISLKRSLFVKRLLLGFLLVSMMFLCLALPRSKNLHSKKIAVIFGLTSDQIFKEKSVASLSDFLLDKRFKFNSEVNFYLVESRSLRYGIKHKENNLITTFDISLYLYKNFLNKSEQLRLSLSAFSSFTHLLLHHKKNNAQIFRVRDLILDAPLAKILTNDVRIKHLIITPSNILAKSMLYSIWKNTTSSSMIWYSGNSIPINHVGRFRELADESFYDISHADSHYVWSDAHKTYLQSFTQSKVIKIGSMMFYPKEISNRPVKDFTLLIFDVTPTIHRSYQKSIYSSALMLNFLQDLEYVQNYLKTTNVQPICWELKPKREYTKHHCSEYVSKLQRMKLDLIDPKVDLYQCIENANFVVCVPYTSPAIIAQELGVPVCYFSTSIDFDLLESLDGIPVHKSVEALRTHIERALADYSKAEFGES
jgi:polysaccharide biosynthesis PFTS motif protein